ncbi:penicillin-binding protein 2 [Candidatus Uhrbacteria bacterium]|nr:penicillin-binding protein 2 [Candidatus Uhrbacteria bacterium]
MSVVVSHGWRHGARRGSRDPRLVVITVIGALAWLAIAARLFTVQVLQRAWYTDLASGQRELFQRLAPERGEIIVHDRRHPNGRFPIATNRRTFTIYAVPATIADPRTTARKLRRVIDVEESVLIERLSKSNDPYEPILRNATNETRDAVLALKLPGIAAEATLTRYYPDGTRVAHLTGFVGEDERGPAGRYGLEGAFNDELTGASGFLDAERDPLGRWIVFGKRAVTRARDGVDLLLTIEREVQLEACRRLEDAVVAHGAAGGTVVILQPTTGAVRAMCSVPAFDPNRYQDTQDLARFNPPAITAAYEPGSVFKPITMSAAIDAGVVEPTTRFTDAGSVTIGGYTITNTDSRVYGERTMADVLRFSINTGAVFAARTLGMERFRSTVERFGFGHRTDIELAGEVAGDTGNLRRPEEVYLATASYGQGIAVTPLQLAAAYAAIANGGQYEQPHVIEAFEYPDGTRRRVEPHTVLRAVSSRTATLVAGMLVSVVQEGYPKRAGVAGHRIGGKTGTAQIPLGDRPGYSSDTIHTFAGFGPVEAPTFAMVVRIDRPKRRFADSTAAPLFGEIAKFILEYDGIAPRVDTPRAE